MSSSPPTPEGDEPGRTPAGPAAIRRSVLLIDDAPEIVEVLLELLRAVGYEVTTATDGIEGLAAMRANRPSVVLLDHNMPRMPGLEVVRVMQEDAALAEIPVILITASPKSVPVSPAPTVRVLPKPFDFDRLFVMLEEATANGEVPSG